MNGSSALDLAMKTFIATGGGKIQCTTDATFTIRLHLSDKNHSASTRPYLLNFKVVTTLVQPCRRGIAVSQVGPSERGRSITPSGAGISCFRLPVTLSLHAGTSSHSPFSRLLLSYFSHRYFLIAAVLTNSIDTSQQRHQTSQAPELPR
jgi:hypothetical protein